MSRTESSIFAKRPDWPRVFSKLGLVASSIGVFAFMPNARASDYSITIGKWPSERVPYTDRHRVRFFARRNAQRRRRLFDRPWAEFRGSHRRRFADGCRQGAPCPIRRRPQRVDDTHRRDRRHSRRVEAIARRTRVLHASRGFQRSARCIHASHGGRSLDIQADQPRSGMALRSTQGSQRHARSPLTNGPYLAAGFSF
ncbi:putative outer membrane protein [Burkholderia pseudomallei MSHR5613]|nr:putative outer membrane protein [Burkholderia pseudomallei MSHR5613]